MTASESLAAIAGRSMSLSRPGGGARRRRAHGARERHPRDLRRGAQLARLPPLPGGRGRGLARRAERRRAGHPRLRRGAAGALGVEVTRETVGSPTARLDGASLRPPPGGRRRPGRRGGAPMRAVNLIPADQRGGAGVGAGRPEGGAYACSACSAVLALFALLYGRPSHQISSRQGQVASLNAQAQRAQARPPSSRPTPASWRCANSACRPSIARRLALRLGPRLPRIRPRAARRDARSPRLDGTTVGLRDGRSASASSPRPPRAGSSSAARRAQRASATPPGSVPTFTLTGCATSQAVVALTLERLRLIDGVSEVTLQSSTKAARGRTGSGRQRPAACEDPSFAHADHLRPAAEPSPRPGSTGSARPRRLDEQRDVHRPSTGGAR